jgi:tRNA (cmo5U34)-methyltransferase
MDVKLKKENTEIAFSEKNASDYDSQRERLSPIKDALHLCISMLLSKLPSDSRILIVGAGTGSELIHLANTYPLWKFTVVEPASAMLDVCRQRAEKSGISSRCTYHEGYLDSLPDTGCFDVATSILVSHFIVNREDRIKYFSEIASRLHPDGYLVEVGLASDMSRPEYKKLLEVWINMHDYAGMPVNIESFGNKVAVLPVEEIESIVESAGFETPILFFQTLLIHAWFSKASAKNYKV